MTSFSQSCKGSGVVVLAASEIAGIVNGDYPQGAIIVNEGHSCYYIIDQNGLPMLFKIVSERSVMPPAPYSLPTAPTTPALNQGSLQQSNLSLFSVGGAYFNQNSIGVRGYIVVTGTPDAGTQLDSITVAGTTFNIVNGAATDIYINVIYNSINSIVSTDVIYNISSAIGTPTGSWHADFYCTSVDV